MALEKLLHKIYAEYDEFLITQNQDLFLEKFLSILLEETNSRFGCITLKSQLKKDLKSIDINTFFMNEGTKHHIMLHVSLLNKEKRVGNIVGKSSFTLNEDKTLKKFRFHSEHFPSIESLLVFPIYLNKKKTNFFMCTLGNREGGYTEKHLRKLSVIMQTIGFLLQNNEGEQELQTQVELLEQFVEHVPAAVAMFDKEMRYIMTSRKWIEQEKNITTRSLKGKLHYDVVQDVPDLWKDYHKKCLNGATIKRKEEKFVRSDGSEQWLKWEVRPWYNKQKVGGILMFLEHVTEFKTVEEQLRQSIKHLKESNEQIERFAYMCSHDLKEPLRTIFSFLQLIQLESKKFITPQIGQYFDFIFQSVKQMQHLIENLLVHSEVRPTKVHRNFFKLSDVVSIVIRNNAHYVLERNAKIIIEEDCSICADKFLITQLIHNLVSNAFKYTQGKAPLVRIGGTFEKDHWTIYVKDNGIGIPKSYHKNFFKNAEKLSRSGKSFSHGIGLIICKIIIESHEGKIWVTSNEEKGATFFFTIPEKMKAVSEPARIKTLNEPVL